MFMECSLNAHEHIVIYRDMFAICSTGNNILTDSDSQLIKNLDQKLSVWNVTVKNVKIPKKVKTCVILVKHNSCKLKNNANNQRHDFQVKKSGSLLHSDYFCG